MTVLGALARRGPQNVLTVPWTTGADVGWSSSTWAGNTVTPESSLQSLTVYGCNRFICDGISTLPVDNFRRKRDGSTVEVDVDAFLKEPAPGLDFTAWATQFLTSLLLAGNFYGAPVYRGSRITAVVPLDPTKVQVTRENGRKVFTVEGQRYSDFEVRHVQGIMWPGSDIGLSPVAAARQWIGTGLAAMEYGSTFFAQDSTPGGVIEYPGELTPEVARQWARSWAQKHGGKDKRGLPGVLSGGAVWRQTSISQEDAQFLETRQFTAAEIAAQMFLIDPPEIGIGVTGQSLTYSNLEQRNARKVQVTFLPWVTRLEKFLTSCLPVDQFAKLNVNGLLRGDTKTRMESHKIAIDTGIETIQEARDLEDLGPLPDVAATPPTLVEQIEALGQLIRAGFTPEAALDFLGLPPIEHTGLTPITVSDDTQAPAPPQEAA